MQIRDVHAVVNGDQTLFEAPSGGVEIVGDDGQALFELHVNKDGVLCIATGIGVCKHNGVLLGNEVAIMPRAVNNIEIARKPYGEGGR